MYQGVAEMEIRKAERGEEQEILALYEDLIVRMRGSEYRPTWEKGVYPVMSDIRSAVEAGTMFIARKGGTVAAAVICNHRQGEGYERVRWNVEASGREVSVIHLLAVRPELHNRGIGERLLRHVIDVCREDGVRAVRLDTLPWNRPGRRLYEKTGFVYCGETRLAYPPAGEIPFSMYEYSLDPEDR